jgi:endonuclease/exonuclease/phosphatase family metal-dependent hydrolase
LAWEARRDRLVARVMTLDGDIVCLQEVEPYVFKFLQRYLEPAGYSGIYAQKGCNRPDGCATFYQSDRLDLTDNNGVYYRDGEGCRDSGHLALIARFAQDGNRFSVTNTHIRWDRHEARGQEHIGYRQANELLANHVSPRSEPCILCGDFNVGADTDVIREVISRGFVDAYAAAPQPTANSEHCAKRIDYLFHSAAYASDPMPLPEIDDETPLPSETEPSDHLPIAVDITFNTSRA